MSFQAQYLRHYSQAYALWKDPKYLAAARDIRETFARTRMTHESLIVEGVGNLDVKSGQAVGLRLNEGHARLFGATGSAL